MKKIIKKQKNFSSSRPLHKKALLHPLSFFTLLCTGVLLAFTTFQAYADTYEVTATVPAPPLTEPAVITYPSDGDHFTKNDVIVTGICPSDSYVKLFNNSVFVGVSQCISNKFNVAILLTAGANVLQAKVFNITNSEGPSSPSVTVYYDPPQPAPEPEVSSPLPGVRAPALRPPASTSEVIPALSVTSPYDFRTLYTSETWKWFITISGGKAPYYIEVIWGDGEITKLSPTNETTLTISHIYTKSGTFHPIIKVNDVLGQTAQHQTLAVVKSTPVVTIAPLTIVSDIKAYLWLIWPAYIIIALMVFSFWLGEYEVLQRLTGRGKRTLNK